MYSSNFKQNVKSIKIRSKLNMVQENHMNMIDIIVQSRKLRVSGYEIQSEVKFHFSTHYRKTKVNVLVMINKIDLY